MKEDKNQKKKCTTTMPGNGVFASTWTHVYPIQEYNQEMQPMLDMLGFYEHFSIGANIHTYIFLFEHHNRIDCLQPLHHYFQ